MIFAFKINTAIKKYTFVKKSQVHRGWRQNNLDFQTMPENNSASKPTQARSLKIELYESDLTQVKQNAVIQKMTYITSVPAGKRYSNLTELHF